VELDWVTFTLEIVNFLVLVWILQHFLYKPVMRTIAQRKAAIDQTLADAKTQQTDAATLERTYRDRLAAWEEEKGRLRAQAKAEIDAEGERQLAALQRTLAAEREKDQVLRQRAMRETQNRLEQEAVAQGAQFAARLLARVADGELQKRLVDMALEDIGRLPDDAVQILRDAWRAGGNKVNIASAFALPAADRGALRQGLAKIIGADPAAEFTEKQELLAGLRITVGPWILRANLQDELKFFAETANRIA
jgi:F-type H+-transporting ATPase subunit b